MKKEWWCGTAQHMWRTYFAILRDGLNLETLSQPDQLFYAVCHHIFLTGFGSPDREIIRMYYTTRPCDDRSVIEDYSIRNNIPVNIVWMVIHRANRSVMEECGFLEKKEVKANE